MDCHHSSSSSSLLRTVSFLCPPSPDEGLLEPPWTAFVDHHFPLQGFFSFGQVGVRYCQAGPKVGVSCGKFHHTPILPSRPRCVLSEGGGWREIRKSSDSPLHHQCIAHVSCCAFPPYVMEGCLVPSGPEITRALRIGFSHPNSCLIKGGVRGVGTCKA